MARALQAQLRYCVRGMRRPSGSHCRLQTPVEFRLCPRQFPLGFRQRPGQSRRAPVRSKLSGMDADEALARQLQAGRQAQLGAAAGCLVGPAPRPSSCYMMAWEPCGRRSLPPSLHRPPPPPPPPPAGGGRSGRVSSAGGSTAPPTWWCCGAEPPGRCGGGCGAQGGGLRRRDGTSSGPLLHAAGRAAGGGG